MAQLRSVSSGTDVLSMSARSTRVVLPHVAAPPSYVSGAEAESLVYAESERLVKISNGALHLLNGFLDQILYDILSKSQSTDLAAVRAAIPQVLKQRLGHAAIKAADEELQDYLEEDELEEMQNIPAVLDPSAEFDVDLAWKLTRLRCMVYAKLGDMEEEDEEDYLEGDDVREHMSQVKDASRSSARIAPACAIFLTTVLEFLAEQGLCIAAQHARKRITYLKDAAREIAPTQRTQTSDTVFLEEIDMSGVGKEGPLIRLWRSWKGSVRTGGSGSSRPTTPSIMSPISPDSPNQEWRFPSAPVIASIKEESRSNTPANIPLPMTDNDVREIEGTELAHSNRDARINQRPTVGKRMSTSMLIMPGQFPDSKDANEIVERPSANRRRSRSVPISPRPTSSTYSDASRKVSVPAGRHASESADDAHDTQSPQSGEDGQADVHSTAMGVTVATIAGALSVEAAKGLRRDRSLESTQPVEPQSAVEPHSSISTAQEFERTHIPLRAPIAVIDASDRAVQEEAADTEETTVELSNDEGADPENNRANPRDSGFGVAGPEDEIPLHNNAAVPAYSSSATNHHNHAAVAPGEVVVPSNRSSNVGYATIFQTPNTSASHSSSNSTRTSGPRTARADDSDVTKKPSTPAGGLPAPAWPAVIPNRRSSLEQKAPEQTDARSPHPPSSQSHGQTHEHTVPRFATSAYARSRSASANQARPSTSGSASVRRQHMRLRSEDPEARPLEELDRAKKSLDLLIDSDETLRYTLTPETAIVGSKPKSQTQELADFFKNTVPPGQEVRPKSSRSAKDGLNGLRANPPTPVTARAPPIQPPVSSPSRPKNPVGEPREARMVRNNTRDLADYARSTGPENLAQLPKSLGPRPSTAQGARPDLPLREKAPGDETRPDTAKTAKTANRLKYQARDAKVPRTTETSDLIDFIREGPPRAAGEHRIDRHVAPFRTTMDSDDFDALAPPPELDAITGRNSQASVPDSAATIKSMHSSMNSRTGLLESTNRAAGKAMSGANAVAKQPIIPESEDGMPKRTRTRVRDPYAIDYSDEEDEVEEFQAPPKKRGGEESLVDFLRNTAPPPGSAAHPILAAVPGPTQPDASNMVKRSTSGSKLKDFLPGGGSANKSNASMNGNGETPAAARQVNIARASSPHLTQAGSKMDKYKPTTATHAAHVDRNRTQNKGRVEPRDGTSNTNRSGTADLAAFLKDSGPPAGTNDKPVQKFSASVQKDQAGFMKFFQRKGSVRK